LLIFSAERNLSVRPPESGVHGCRQHCASGGANTAERNGAAAVDVPPVTGLRRAVLRSGENRRVVDL
jgi:hypothetical protein